MMIRFESMPPHTFGIFRPACSATSMNWTGDVAAGVVTAAFTWNRSPSFHTGVMSVSSSVLPSTKREDPRKRRRGMIIILRHYRNSRLLLKTRDNAGRGDRTRLSLAAHLGKRMRDDACAFLHRDDGIDRDAGEL